MITTIFNFTHFFICKNIRPSEKKIKIEKNYLIFLKINLFFLKYIYLEGNQISKLSNRFFQTFKQLKWLDVRKKFFF